MLARRFTLTLASRSRCLHTESPTVSIVHGRSAPLIPMASYVCRSLSISFRRLRSLTIRKEISVLPPKLNKNHPAKIVVFCRGKMKRPDLCDYAQSHACFRSGEIRLTPRSDTNKTTAWMLAQLFWHPAHLCTGVAHHLINVLILPARAMPAEFLYLPPPFVKSIRAPGTPAIALTSRAELGNRSRQQ
jgi:hypothetical protein